MTTTATHDDEYSVTYQPASLAAGRQTKWFPSRRARAEWALTQRTAGAIQVTGFSDPEHDARPNMYDVD